MKKILITDSVDERCAEILKTSGYSVTCRTDLSRDELLKIIADFNVLIVRSATQVDAEVISKMDNMELIGRAGAGTDNIDIHAATRKGILVMNTPGGNTISAAEHTMALMLAMSRKIPQANLSMHLKKWDRKKFQGTELFGKTLGLIGLGKIGKEVASRAKAFAMKVIAYDPILNPEIIDDREIQLVFLEDIWKNADIISVHTPLNDHTKNLISYEVLSKCKKGVAIINCARGGIVNEKDLLRALEEGIVSSAALDVFETEPPDFNNGLTDHPSVVSTPHLGASTEEAQQKVAVQIAEQVVSYFNNGSLAGAVNASSFKEITNENLNSFINLSERLGKVLSQLRKGSLKKISITCKGELLGDYSDLLSTSMLKGFLTEELDEAVNFINAGLIAEETGIVMEKIIFSDHKGYQNLLSVSMITDSSELSLDGTVFNSNELRIVAMNHYPVEFKPEGNILIYRNVDKPGMLASVTRLLSEENINIANLSLGRIDEGNIALTVINIDSPVSSKQKASISSIAGIYEVYQINL